MNTKHPETTHDLGRALIDIVTSLQAHAPWGAISTQVESLQRIGRHLLADDEESLQASSLDDTVETAIAEGYLTAAKRNLSAIMELIGRLPATEAGNPQVLSLCLAMLNLTAQTMHKYIRAAEAEARIVAEARITAVKPVELEAA